MELVSFPLNLPTDEKRLDFLKSSNWTTVNDRHQNESVVPPFHISSIRATKLEDGSKVQIILSYMVIVIICNILKLVVMWQLWRNSSNEFLTTVGDAVQSFLREPDRSTIGLCLMDRQSLIDGFQLEHNRRTALISMAVQTIGEAQKVLIQPDRREQQRRRLPRVPSGAEQKSTTTLCPPQKLKHNPPLLWDGQTIRGGRARLVYGSTSRWSTSFDKPYRAVSRLRQSIKSFY